ncbi:hypothetical protein WMF11_37680 [Sorangium sp. So ce295]
MAGRGRSSSGDKPSVKGARIPLEAAILLAASFGMHVLGFTEKDGG